MIHSTRAWALEQNDRRLVFATGTEATMFAESGAFRVTRHLHPAWKVVLPVGGHAEIGLDGRNPLAAAGLIVPPQLAHTCVTTSPYAALFIDPWLLRGAPGEPIPLDATAVRRLLDALGTTGIDGPGSAPDLTAAHTELTAFTGAALPLDPRVAHALRTATHPGPGPGPSLDSIATDVGLSAPRLRALVHASVGIPLARLRQWGRLRTGFAALPDATVATAAADAGFSDQAHLTRTARSLLGRAPSTLRSAAASLKVAHCHEA